MHVGVFAISKQRLTAHRLSTNERSQHTIKSLLHYFKLKQTPAPLRLGEWNH